MTRSGIEPRPPAPRADALTTTLRGGGVSSKGVTEVHDCMSTQEVTEAHACVSSKEVIEVLYMIVCLVRR